MRRHVQRGSFSRSATGRLTRFDASRNRTDIALTTSFAISPELNASSYHRHMSSNDRCLFCRIANGDISARKVYEDDDVFAFKDINPQAPTHVLITPRKHIASLDDLGDGDAAIIG